MIRDFVSVDLETTGLDPKKDKILEIGAIRFRDGKETSSFHALLDPGREIPQRVSLLTGITQEDVKGKPWFCEIQTKLVDFLGEDILLSHNIRFDYAFLKRALIQADQVTGKGTDTFEKRGIDTLKIARIFLPHLESRSLSYLCGYYHIPIHAHRSLEDARATAQLYLKMTEDFLKGKQENQPYFEAIDLVYKVKKEGPATAAQKERLYKVLDKHKINIGCDIERLTKNEASRYLDTIYAEYGR